MRRPSLILTGVLAVGLLVFTASWRISSHLCTHQAVSSVDDLAWLKEEFCLTDAELDRVRQIHQAYLPECEAFCREIATRQERLNELLKRGDLADAEVETTLVEIGEWRARCQANMLRHFLQVADAMPAEQGSRFLEVMIRLTLGGHETIEQQMSADAPGGSGEHMHGSQR